MIVRDREPSGLYSTFKFLVDSLGNGIYVKIRQG